MQRRVRSRRHRWTAVWLGSLLLALFGRATDARATFSAPAVVVEVTPDAARIIEPQRTRRLVGLELSDIDVPELPGLPADTIPTLFFRVLVASPSSLRVELWQLGSRHGSRSVSSIGAPQLITRRIALAAAELARQLRQDRRLAMSKAKQKKPEEPKEQHRTAGAPLHARLAFEAGTAAAAVGLGNYWLVGPALGGSLRFDTGARLALGLRWLAGGVPRMAPDGAMRWLELSLSPSYAMACGARCAVDVGATAAVAAVHATRARGVDSTPSMLDTWTGRATGHVRLELHLAPGLRLSAGPEVGATLRRFAVEDISGRTRRLGGLYLGGALSFVIDPAAR